MSGSGGSANMVVLRQRLGAKTRLVPREQMVVVTGELCAEEPTKRKVVYLVTLSHPLQATSASGRPLRSPDSYDREELLRCLLDAFANPVYTDVGHQAAFGGRRRLQVLKLVIFAEYHKPDEQGVAHRHYHVAVQAAESFLFNPFKKASSVAAHQLCNGTNGRSTKDVERVGFPFLFVIAAQASVCKMLLRSG